MYMYHYNDYVTASVSVCTYSGHMKQLDDIYMYMDMCTCMYMYMYHYYVRV